jgi:hypothetical protein
MTIYAPIDRPCRVGKKCLGETGLNSLNIKNSVFSILNPGEELQNKIKIQETVCVSIFELILFSKAGFVFISSNIVLKNKIFPEKRNFCLNLL